MAISSSNYVGASVFSAADVSLVDQSYAGLVITGSEMTSPEDAALLAKKGEYDAGKMVSLSSADASVLFGQSSAEKNFATGYYSYIAPNGLFPQNLYFKKCRTSDLVAEVQDAFSQPYDFGSFTFLSVPDDSRDSDLKVISDIAAFNSSSENRKLYVVNYKKTSDGISYDYNALRDLSNSLSSVRGCCLVYGSSDWSAFMPMAILAAQNFATSGVLQFMFNRFVPPVPGEDVPTVTDDNNYTGLSALNVNFLGRTQVNGQQLDFFQRGYATNGEDLTATMVVNWIEQQTRAGIMNLFLNRVMPATDQSVIAVEGVISSVMLSARDNNLLYPINQIPDASHKEIMNDIISVMGGTVQDVTNIETDLGIYGYGSFVTLNGIKNLGNLSGGKSEPTISYKAYYAYAGAIRYVGGNYKVVVA